MHNIKLSSYYMIFLLIANGAAYAMPSGNKSGDLPLSDYSRSGYIAHSSQVSMELVSGSEIISITPFEKSNAGKYELHLKGLKKGVIRFYSAYEDSNYKGYCTIEFTQINKDKTHFQVVEDSTLYGCGIDANGYMRINF